VSIIGNPLRLLALQTVTVTVLGAKNEVVSYTGDGSGSITLDANGEGTANIRKGTYTFTGGVSGYSKAYTVNASMTVYVRPVACIYWYGVKLGTITPSTGSSPTYYDTYFQWNFPSNSDYAALRTGNNGSGYSSVTVKTTTCNMGGYGFVTYHNADSPGTSWSHTATLSNNGTVTHNYTYASGYQIRISGYNYKSRGYYTRVQEWYLGDR